MSIYEVKHFRKNSTIDNASRLCLTLDTITQFDDTVGNFDSASGDFELGGTDTTSNPNFSNSNRDAKGFYNFTNRDCRLFVEKYWFFIWYGRINKNRS